MKRSRTYLPDMGAAFLIAIAALILLTSSGLPTVQQARAAETPKPVAAADVQDLSTAWVQQLDYIGQLLTREKRLSQEARELFGRIIDSASANAKVALAREEKNLRPLRKELDSLGPVPKEGETEESTEIIALRQQLQDRVSQAEERVQKLRLVLVRTENLKAQLSLRETQEMQRLLRLSPSLFDVATWHKANETLSRLSKRIAVAPSAWWEDSKGKLQPAWVIGVVLVGLLVATLAILARQWLRRRFARQETADEAPGKAQRIIYAALVAFAEMILPWAGLGAMAAAISAIDLGNTFFETILVSLCFSGMAFFAVSGLARAALAPQGSSVAHSACHCRGRSQPKSPDLRNRNFCCISPFPQIYW